MIQAYRRRPIAGIVPQDQGQGAQVPGKKIDRAFPLCPTKIPVNNRNNLGWHNSRRHGRCRYPYRLIPKMGFIVRGKAPPAAGLLNARPATGVSRFAHQHRITRARQRDGGRKSLGPAPTTKAS
jgi:hypothetical protein